MNRPHPPAHAFTLVELIASIVVCALIVGMILPALGGACGCGQRRPFKDSNHLRGIVQSMIMWSQNNRGSYPLPSAIDPGSTVAAQGAAKDTTGNILSILIWNGTISTEVCVSPAEANTAQVESIADYAFQSPAAAVDPANALWDPRFRGTPIDPALGGLPAGAPGNQSYAHIIPCGNRLKLWRDNASTTEAVLGNRGPRYAPDDRAPHPADGRWALVDGPLGRGSNTLLIHGRRETWEGCIARNDGSVRFEHKPSPDDVTYTRYVGARSHAAFDNLFVSESDELDGDARPGAFDRGVNAFLRPIAERGEAGAGGFRLWVD